jgi:phosphoenolpyruvate synthase/pyruvate phosphate dikinase
MDLIKPFKELGKDDAAIAGGKGASLGEMTQAGIPVPPGFVILANAFERFIIETELIAEIDAILEKVNHHEMHTVENASETIQGLILHAQMPTDLREDILKSFQELNTEFVAVRSSATAEDGAEAAWAGQLDTFLNTTKETLLEKVQECWASLFTPRAIFYRFEKGMDAQKISVAVVVQKMVNSDAAGIAFSVHPVTEDYNQMIIEAGFGLGEAVVSGQVTPDSYIVTKEPLKIIEESINEQGKGLYRKEGGGNEWKDLPQEKGNSQVLSKDQIFALANVLMQIENHYGFPVDTEWAMENNELYIVQSRPITTLSSVTDTTIEGIDPSAYTFNGLWKCNLFSDWFWTQWLVPEYAKRIGLELSDGGIFVIHGGNFFTKKEVMGKIKEYIKSILDSKDSNRLSDLKNLAQEIYTRAIPETERLAKQDVTEETFMQIAERGREIMFPWCFGYILSEVLDEFLLAAAEHEGIAAEDISHFLPPLRTPLMESQESLRDLKIEIEAKGYWDLLKNDATKTIQSMKKDMLISKHITDHAKKYGWVNVFNLLGTDSTFEQIVDQITFLQDSSEEVSNSKKLSAEFSFMLECAATTAYLRQSGVEYFSIYSQQALPYFKKTAEKLQLEYMQFLDLNLSEIISGIQGNDVKAIVERRAGDMWAIRSSASGEPIVIDDKDVIMRLENMMVPKAQNAEENVIQGQTGNKGVATGVVRIFFTPEGHERMNAGDILVTTMTTPDFVPMMQKAGAIVTDIGGLLCHAAIISREIGKPCVIGTKFATQLLHDGDLVEVDANNGVVRILTKSDLVINQSSEKSSPKEIFGDKNLYFNIGLWTSPTIEWEAWMNWLNTTEAKAMGIPHDPHASTVINHNYLFRTDGSYIWIKDACYKQFKEGKYTLAKEILKLGDKFGDECIELSKTIKEAAAFSEFEETYELMKRIRFPWMACFAVSDAAEMILKEYSELHDESLDDISAAVPQWENSVNKDQKTLNHLKKEIEKSKLGFSFKTIKLHNESLAEEIEKYQKETEFIGTHHFWGEPRMMERLMDAITHAVDSHQTKKNEYQELAELFDVIAWATKVRLECAQNSSQLAYAFRPMLDEIAKTLSLVYEELIFLRISEIKDAISSGKVDKAIIQEREKGYAIFCYNEDVRLAVGKELESYEEYFGLKEELEYTNEIKGNIGNKGKVTGTVVIVKTPRDHSKVQKGMILVAPETTPDFIPVMGKAAAFITDLGGITSHAAIVAREMNKPCIIGTKVATRMLKDGDLVEVDADNGIVRILKKTDVAHLEKAYTRDATSVIQQSWFGSVNHPIFSEVPNPNAVTVIDYMSDGVYEIWINPNALTWIKNTLQEYIRTKPDDYIALLDTYEKNLLEVKKYWEGEPLADVEALESYVTLSAKMVREFDAMYFASIDDRTPDFLMTRIRKMRDEDSFIDSSDRVIRNSLVALYPNLKGYEQCILASEIRIPPSIDILKERKNNFIVIGEDYAEVISLQEYQDQHPEMFFEIEHPSVGSAILKGQIGNKGKVQGVVRILKRKEQISDAQEGDVIVSAMTTPDFMPAMQKAAAIVTDEGGITCHAAIVARELGKPCVIGTKFATQVLKDGDLVEVDADNGVVRILSARSPIIFKKSYSRDTTLFMQGLWAKGLVELPLKKFGWENPHLPFVAHYVNDGVVEIWEHKEAISWMLDKVLVENQEGNHFLESLLAEYLDLLEKLKVIHAKSQLTSENLDVYQKLVYEAAFAMTIFFYTGGDERNPKEAQDISVKAREAGDFFADNDVFVRSHLSNLSAERAGVVLPEELHSIPAPGVLSKRLESCLLIDGKDWGTDDLQNFMRKHSEYIFEKDEVVSTKEIKGQSAYKGIVKGHVRIVKKHSDMERVLKGDILVSPMTTPDFLPAMIRAAAFITDEGGVTCHAAIVAREMEKPCIIGTKIATRVLKDGDLVEVDADKGIVRKV